MWWSSLALLGGGIGVLSGLYGVGGAFLLTPLLMTLFGLAQPVAAGTGLCQTIGTATAAMIRHRRLGHGEFKIDVILLAGSLLGVQQGVSAARYLETRSAATGGGAAFSPAAEISCVYLALLIVIAVGILRGEPKRLGSGEPGFLARIPIPPYTVLPATGVRISIPVLAYVGLGLGFLSGLLGIGGGVLLVPLLVHGLGVPLRTVAGTGILLLLATALVGTAAYARAGLVDRNTALVLLAGSTVGAQIGASLAGRLRGRWLRWGFIAMIAAAGVVVAWQIWQRASH
jgi:uncharacterized membrane protein YfcA